MAEIRSIKGMNDLFEDELVWWRRVTKTAEAVFQITGTANFAPQF